MSENTSESCEYIPFTFTSANGNEVKVNDEWADGIGVLSRATVIDKVTDEEHRFILVETDDEFSWLRRIDEACYVDTGIYAPMDHVPEDPEELTEVFWETVGEAETELVMAIGLFPRYNIEADWMEKSLRDSLNKMQSQADDAASEDVEKKRQELLGISNLF